MFPDKIFRRCFGALLIGLGAVLAPAAQAAVLDVAAIDDGADSLRKQVVETALRHLGSPYQFGAAGDGRFDCSGLAQTAFRAVGHELPRTARAMLAAGERIAYEDARPGDLMLYDWGSRRGSGLHVMIYLGDGLAIHASPSARKVRLTQIARPIWKRRLVGISRVLPPT